MTTEVREGWEEGEGLTEQIGTLFPVGKRPRSMKKRSNPLFHIEGGTAIGLVSHYLASWRLLIYGYHLGASLCVSGVMLSLVLGCPLPCLWRTTGTRVL